MASQQKTKTTSGWLSKSNGQQVILGTSASGKRASSRMACQRRHPKARGTAEPTRLPARPQTANKASHACAHTSTHARGGPGSLCAS
eukprot:447238-Pelagomonas_calceolata.AAC.1